MKKVLVAGPDNGLEFGWFLMRWQAKIRYMAQDYDDTYVITTKDRYPFYEDFARNYQDMMYSQNMWRFDGVDIDYVQPNKKLCCSVGVNMFMSYSSNSKRSGIVLHTRKKNDDREWDIKKWIDFITKLRKYYKGKLYNISTDPFSYNLNHCDLGLYRCISTWAVIESLMYSELCVGPSSGPMHLASLCKCPHLVWTDNKKWNLGAKKGTNRERYETEWNPFKTPVTVMDDYGWDPPVNKVLDKVLECLDK